MNANIVMQRYIMGSLGVLHGIKGIANMILSTIADSHSDYFHSATSNYIH